MIDEHPPEPGAAAREHVLALLTSSPVYARVARLLGVDCSPVPPPGGEVRARLAKLPRGWRLLPAAGIDHLVVGPGGVFAVIARHHPRAKVSVRGDTFKVNGRNRRHVSESRYQAARVTRLLSSAAGFDVDVHGVVAVTGAERGFAVKAPPRDVTVVNRKTITPYLHSLPVVLAQPSIDRIADVARRQETWHDVG